jgi:lysozyme
MPLTTPDVRLVNQLIAHEALRLRAYDDATGRELRPGDTLRGNLTIGVGRNLTANGISTQEAYVLLLNDVNAAIGDLARNLPWFDALDEVRQAVLIDMCFNLGWARLAQFDRTLDAIADGRYSEAADFMLASKWAGQVGPRAVRLAQMMRSGQWSDA